jgi:hypothetical protein
VSGTKQDFGFGRVDTLRDRSRSNSERQNVSMCRWVVMKPRIDARAFNLAQKFLGAVEGARGMRH